MFRGGQVNDQSCFPPPKCTCSSPDWPAVSVRVAIKINGYNCGSVSPLCSPTHWPFSPSISPPSLAVVRVPADEDGTAQVQHIYHSLPAVDHCHRAHLPRGDPRGEASEKHTPLNSQSSKRQIIYMQRISLFLECSLAVSDLCFSSM